MATKVMEVNFSKVFGGTPREFIYEDDQCVAFNEELNPQAPVHFLVVPRRVMPRLCDATELDEKLLGHILVISHKLASERGLSGYHVMLDEEYRASRLNAVHVFGRALHHMMWPTGPGAKL